MSYLVKACRTPKGRTSVWMVRKGDKENRFVNPKDCDQKTAAAYKELTRTIGEMKDVPVRPYDYESGMFTKGANTVAKVYAEVSDGAVTMTDGKSAKTKGKTATKSDSPNYSAIVKALTAKGISADEIAAIIATL